MGTLGCALNPSCSVKKLQKSVKTMLWNFLLQLWDQQHLRASLEAELEKDNGNAKCFVITAPAIFGSSLDARCLTHTSARHVLWKGNSSLVPHPWKVITLLFKVDSLASGPIRVSRSSRKSPSLWRNGSSGSSLGFCKDFRILFQRTNPKWQAQKWT